MIEDQLFQTQPKEFMTTGSLANYTFSSKNREAFIDLKDPKASLDVELTLLKEQHRRTLIELARITTQNRDFKAQISQLESRLQSKDREISELKCQQTDRKFEVSRRLKERDLNLPKPSVKYSLDENTIDGKTMRSMLSRDSSIEKLNSQNKSLKKEVDKLTEKLKKLEDAKTKDSYDSYCKMTQDLSHKLKMAELASQSLLKKNDELKDSAEKATGEANQLKKENSDIKKKYEDLKCRYESLETTATSNKADRSTESGVGSESGGSRNNISYSNKFMTSDTTRFNTERNMLTLRIKGSSGDFTLEEYKKLINEIMGIYCVKTPNEIIPSIQKTEKVVQMVPKLRKILSEVAALVLPKTGYPKEKGQIELVLPSVKKLCKDLDELEVLRSLKVKLMNVLELEKDCTNLDILKKVDKLATLCYQTTNESKSQISNSRDCVEDTLLSTQFVKIFGIQPSISVFRQIIKQLDEFKHFIGTVKHKLKLDSDMKNDLCLNHLLKCLETSGKDKQILDVIYRLQKTFNCGLDALVYTIERVIFDKREKPYSYGGQI